MMAIPFNSCVLTLSRIMEFVGAWPFFLNDIMANAMNINNQTIVPDLAENPNQGFHRPFCAVSLGCIAAKSIVSYNFSYIFWRLVEKMNNFMK